MNADKPPPPERPGPWDQPLEPAPPPNRFDDIGASWAGLLQTLKAAAILALVVALIRLFSR